MTLYIFGMNICYRVEAFEHSKTYYSTCAFGNTINLDKVSQLMSNQLWNVETTLFVIAYIDIVLLSAKL